jgi:hypothetical protein
MTHSLMATLVEMICLCFELSSFLLVLKHFWLFNYMAFILSAEDAQLTPVLRLGAGACAGIIAMSATYPMDMVRGRITVQVSFSFILPDDLFVVVDCNGNINWRKKICLWSYSLTGSVFPCICRLRNPLISTEECSTL